MTGFESFVSEALAKQGNSNLLRVSNEFEQVSATKLVFDGKSYINFSSNDYLGLASDFDITEFTNWLSGVQSHAKPAVRSGAMASPLVTGNSQHHKQLINDLLKAIDAPSSFSGILFGSGFSANQGVLNALFKDKSKEQFVYQDKLNHASLLDAGTKLQAAGHLVQKRFKHNDVKHLSQLIKPDPSLNQLVVTESVFSMDGDKSPIKDLSALARQVGSLVMVDDAHGFGLSALAKGVTDIDLNDVDIYLVTFGKALGAQGAALFARRSIIDFLTNFSKEYIYSTHLSPIQCETVRFNLSKLVAAKSEQFSEQGLEGNEQIKPKSCCLQLANNIAYFRKIATGNDLPLLPSDTAIQPIMIGDAQTTVEVANDLKARGFWVSAIRPPTVKKGQSRLRVTITSKHTLNEINGLVVVLNSALQKRLLNLGLENSIKRTSETVSLNHE